MLSSSVFMFIRSTGWLPFRNMKTGLRKPRASSQASMNQIKSEWQSFYHFAPDSYLEPGSPRGSIGLWWGHCVVSWHCPEAMGKSQGTELVRWAKVRSTGVCCPSQDADAVRVLTRHSCLSVLQHGKWVTEKTKYRHASPF